MAIFNSNERRFYRVVTGEAGAYAGGSLRPDEILMTTGPEVAALRERVRVGRVVELPDPGALLAWLAPQIREVDASTFEPSPRVEVPEAPPTLSEAEVLARFPSWTADDLAHAMAAIDFPKPFMPEPDLRHYDQTGQWRERPRRWSRARVDQWQLGWREKVGLLRELA